MSANKENAPAGPASASGTTFAGTSEKLLDLASRCEKATGPSCHLDTQIFILLDPDAQHIVGQKPGPWPQEAIYGPRSTYWEWALDESKEPPQFAAIPHYTASLDAAMTLVPEGHEWLKLSPFTASIYHFVEDDKEWAKHIEAKGNTFPLALCAAALKARTHKEEAS
jgi:hypothetical protein